MKTLDFTVVSGATEQPLKFTVRRMVNVGYSGRNREAVRAHVEELAKLGVPAPTTTPTYFPVLSQNITTDDEIEVVTQTTSGEIEAVFLVSAGGVYVGVGSDHTDRELEVQSVIKSKQLCPNVVSKTVWRLEDVAPHWDELIIRSFVGDGAREQLYQEAPLKALLPAAELLRLVEAQMSEPQRDGIVVYSGTVPLRTKEPQYAEYFRGELFDPKLNRKLGFTYRVRLLNYLVNC